MPGPEVALMRDMGLDAAEVERRKAICGLTADDGARIARMRGVLEPLIPDLVQGFFAHLARFDAGGELLTDPRLFERTRALKVDHLKSMLAGTYDERYVRERAELGLLFGRVQLPQHLFLGAYQGLLDAVGAALARNNASDVYSSVRRVSIFDISLIVDVLTFERERVIRRQAEAIRELSVPVLQLRERMLLLPLVGLIDTHRARQVTESLLHGIRAARARVVVMDVTGVPSVDTKVAHHLLQTVAAARLMGAKVIITGLSPDISQALVLLGIDLKSVTAMGDLQSGLEEAERLSGAGGAAYTAAQ